jgi:hypothetical protein
MKILNFVSVRRHTQKINLFMIEFSSESNCKANCNGWFHAKCIGFRNTKKIPKTWMCFICKAFKEFNGNSSNHISATGSSSTFYFKVTIRSNFEILYKNII